MRLFLLLFSTEMSLTSSEAFGHVSGKRCELAPVMRVVTPQVDYVSDGTESASSEEQLGDAKRRGRSQTGYEVPDG